MFLLHWGERGGRYSPLILPSVPTPVLAVFSSEDRSYNFHTNIGLISTVDIQLN